MSSSNRSSLNRRRPSIYSERQPVEPIQIIYTHGERGWYATSPDLLARFDEGLSAGDSTYEKTRQRVITVMSLGPEHDDHVLEHYIAEASIPAFVAEQQRAAAKTAVG
jgi:hypothetical protein